TRRGPGSAITICSPTCCNWSCAEPRRPRLTRCTRQPPGGSRTMGIRSGRARARGSLVEAVRHARAGGTWTPAARLLADHWPGLQLDGQAATVHALLVRFPAEARTAGAGLSGLTASGEGAAGSLAQAERFLGLAARGTVSVPPDRRGQLDVLLAMVRLLLARQRGNLPAAAEEA